MLRPGTSSSYWGSFLVRNYLCYKSFQPPGVVAEWFKAAVLKTADRATGP